METEPLDDSYDEPAPPKAKKRDPEESKTPNEKANLAAYMNEQEQAVWSQKCCDRYESDLQSRADRMKKLKLLQEMHALIMKRKDFPFQNAANIRTPSLTGPVLQIESRLYDMVWPITGRVFTVVPATAEDGQFATMTERFANSYCRYKMPYMAQGMRDTLHQMCLYGSSFRRTYWNDFERRVRSDWVPMDDFVVAYKQRSQDPSMSDVPRYTMRHHMTRAEIQDYGADGIFINTDKLGGQDDKGGTEEQDSEFKQASDKIDGTSFDENDSDWPRPVLEQHCRWKLPNKPKKHPSFDGKPHYVVVTLDARSRQVLRISLREEDDPDDRRRFLRDLAKHNQYLDDLATFKEAQWAPPPPVTQPTMSQLPGMSAPTMTPPPAPGGPPDTTMPSAGPPQLPPEMMGQPTAPMEPPDPVPEPRPMRKRQICFFTHYRCFPSDGFYGLGYGDMLYGLAVAMNTMINQTVDGGTLRSALPMFMSRQVRMQRGAVNIQPGEVVEIDGPVNQIRDAIMFLDPPKGDMQTIPLVKMLDAMKDTMVGNSDLMSGQVPGSNQTKGGMEILNENMMAPISVLGRDVREAFGHDLAKMWRCWGVFLEDDDFADVVAEGNVPQQVPISKSMFTPSAHLVPASDPRLKSVRMEDHKQLFGYCMQNPMISQDPNIGRPILSKLTEMGFRLFPDGEQLLPLLQPPQPPPPQPMPQWAENAGFLRGQNHPVLPTDNHDEHLQELGMFMASPDSQLLSPDGKKMAEQHMRDHRAAKIEEQGAQLEQQRQQFAGAGPGQGPGPGGPAPTGPPGPPPGPGGQGFGALAGPPRQSPPGPPPPGGM